MNIRTDNATRAAVLALLDEHLREMYAASPPESVHALDLSELRASDVTFWTAWDGEELLGCGALKALDAKHGEIKTMRTSRKHLRKGVAAAILEHITNVARERGYERLSLETGSGGPFDAALRFYEKHGFEVVAGFPSTRRRYRSRALRDRRGYRY